MDIKSGRLIVAMDIPMILLPHSALYASQAYPVMPNGRATDFRHHKGFSTIPKLLSGEPEVYHRNYCTNRWLITSPCS
uniref:Secreted protein n=1 Tax=Ascaris lumbricoides TaxID=6252 RepID=A0A0M3I227_ASCLU